MPDHLLRWRGLETVGLEHCHVREAENGVTVESLLIASAGPNPIAAAYTMVLMPDWTFRSIRIERPGHALWRLAHDATGRWTINDTPAPHLEGCIDIDLSGSPLTNTLPIRRARLLANVPQRFEMAWIDVADLSVHRDGQIYTRLDAHRVRYQSADSEFEAVLTLDDHGFVRDYPGLFTRLG
ncbi:hypothetical protein SAMN02983003_1753 [Devosia enhydra]|uniref:Glycolipid-binding n=1 Tax=Devosia enhydra TaxID=665118 RepID=A0A1K2HWV1_9HYPH|nr:putative glycolipid-binding domain-containing protein [Devosia enhydra]SFZ83622.1 hypothetical protein SAMN02983003_1753 [Devosia enhydra]